MNTAINDRETTNEEEMTLASAIHSTEWKMQQFVAFQNSQLVDTHKELFHSIFGEARTNALKRMLWSFPQEEYRYPDVEKLARTNSNRKAGLFMFLGHDEKDITEPLSQEQNFNISRPPLLPGGSRKLNRGAKLKGLAVAQIHENNMAKIHLGMHVDQIQSSSSSPSISAHEPTAAAAPAVTESTVSSREY